MELTQRHVEYLKEAEKLAGDWHKCMRNGRPGATDADIESAFIEIAVLLAAVRLEADHG